jgi:hypothetical protein
VTVGHDADLAASIRSIDATVTPHHVHQCRHAGCHWRAGEPSPDVKLIASDANATNIDREIPTQQFGRPAVLRAECDVGRYCALLLRLQFMSGVLQI